jgi:short-subunit dehydrogenase
LPTIQTSLDVPNRSENLTVISDIYQLGRAMNNSTLPVALVTGASSGIGWATAKALTASGYRVVITARREERLLQLAGEIGRDGGAALPIPADLAQEVERERLIAVVGEHWGHVDVLVNNAAHGWIGWQAEIPAEIRRHMLAVNVDAVVHLTNLVLPAMLARRSGHIVNVASVAGDFVLPPDVLYSATKTFVQGFSRGLHRELRGTGVRVSVVNPGPVKTEFQRVANGVPVDQRPDLEQGVPPETVAQAIVNVLRSPRRSVYVPGALGLAAVLAPMFGWFLDRFGRIIAVERMRLTGKTLTSRGSEPE